MLNRLRESRWPRWMLVLVALGFCAYGLASNWEQTTAAIARLSPWSIAGSTAAALVALGCAVMAWRTLLAGLGSPLPVLVAVRIFFLGQLAKYIPGAVWMIAATAELGRDYHCPPRRTFAATVTALAATLACALTTAALTLPWDGQHAWVIGLAPVFLAGLHPKILMFGLNLVMRVARREPLDPIPGTAVVRAIAWSFAAIAFFGLMFGLPLAEISTRPLTEVYFTAAGAYMLGWAGALLLVVFPAGAGAREIALATVLTPILPWQLGLVVAVVTRLAITIADLTWGGIAFLIGRHRPAGATPWPAETREVY